MTKPSRLIALTATAAAAGFMAGCYNPPERTYAYDPPGYKAPIVEQASPPRVQVIADTNRTLEERVRQQFSRYGDLGASAASVSITARNGAVTLTGPVATQQDRIMILAAAENIPGVIKVDDQMRVSLPVVHIYPTSNSTVAKRVRQALQDDPATAPFASSLEVIDNGGTITLRGTVPTAADEELVQTIARETSGVVGVVNEVDVSLTPTGRETVAPRIRSGDLGEIFSLHVQGLSETDRTLAQNVLQGLRTDAVVIALLPSVDIHVDDGQVKLTGTVLSERQRQAIVSAVRRAAGVDNVTDELRVVPSE